MIARYAALLRPPGPGAVPRDGLLQCGYAEETTPSGRRSWGWAEYSRELAQEEIIHYDMEHMYTANETHGEKTPGKLSVSTARAQQKEERIKLMPTKKATYDMDYRRRAVKPFAFDLNKVHDADIIEHLEKIEKRTPYIKALIRADIARTKTMEEKTMKRYQIEYTDANGATSPIDTVTAPAGYTADDYIRNCQENAEPEWCEMLEHGTVSVVEIDD